MKRACLLFCVSIITIATFFGCATVPFNEETFAQGKWILASFDRIVSSLPLEEHAYVINLAYEGISEGLNTKMHTGITHIDGTQASKLYTNIPGRVMTIVPAGEHTFSIERNTSSSGVYETVYTAKVKMTVDLLSGHYYFLGTPEIDGDKVVFKFDDLDNYSEVIAGQMILPVEVVIQGMNAVIAKKFKGFVGRSADERK